MVADQEWQLLGNRVVTGMLYNVSISFSRPQRKEDVLYPPPPPPSPESFNALEVMKAFSTPGH